jgi:hypothetical protein
VVSELRQGTRICRMQQIRALMDYPTSKKANASTNPSIVLYLQHSTINQRCNNIYHCS